MAENPSADKFGPPPEQATREREAAKTGGKAGGVLGVTAMGIGVAGVAALRIFAHAHRGKTGAVAALLAGGGYVAMDVIRRQQRNSRDGEPDPYTPPSTITR
jgi:hypothetical protein